MVIIIMVIMIMTMDTAGITAILLRDTLHIITHHQEDLPVLRNDQQELVPEEKVLTGIIQGMKLHEILLIIIQAEVSARVQQEGVQGRLITVGRQNTITGIV